MQPPARSAPTLADILVPGVSGKAWRVASYPRDVVETFRGACDRAAAAVAGRVAGFDPDETRVCHSYHAAIIEAPGREVEHILLHSVLPFITATRTLRPPHAFSSTRRLAGHFAAPFLILPRELLETPLDLGKVPLAGLREQELYDLRYWEPARVGDLVFNDFD